jgi:hypothetical protein
MIIPGIFFYVEDDYKVHVYPKDWNITNRITKPLPREGLSKQECVAWSFVSLIDNKPALQSEQKFDKIYAMIIDYDSSATNMNTVKEKFNNYEYFMHTSWSHLEDGFTEKFKLILPLSEPINYNEYIRCRTALKKQFRFCDKSTFSTGRKQFLPYEGPYYEYHINSGIRYDFKTIQDSQKFLDGYQEIYATEQTRRYLESSCNNNVNIDWEKIEKELNDIINQPDGSGRYNNVLTWIVKWKEKTKNPMKISYILEHSNYKHKNSFKGMFK